jgi:hypothetical protein
VIVKFQIANIKAGVGVAAAAALAGVGAWGLTGTAQADNTPLQPNISNNTHAPSNNTGGLFGGFLGGGSNGFPFFKIPKFPTIPSTVKITGFPQIPTISTIPSKLTIAGFPQIPTISTIPSKFTIPNWPFQIG